MRLPLLGLLAVCALPAGEADPPASWGEAPARMAWVGGLGLGAVAAYGFSTWGWGESSFSTRSEGWFGPDTPYGGADKLGHAFTASALTAIGAALARDAGADPWPAAVLGGATAALWTTAIEIGDGFSPDYGASWEDEACNLLGVGVEMLRQGFPWLAERVQYRWEWLPSPLMLDGTTTDVFSDYSGSRYILAFPLAPWLEAGGPLRYVELIAGYGTTGFDDPEHRYYDQPERTPFVGIGLSLGQTLDRAGCPRPGRMLEYVQVPYTAYPWQERP